MTPKADEAKPNHIAVATVTTSGVYPTEGYNQVPLNQPIRVELQRAEKAFELTDTGGWVATVDGRPLNVSQSYAASGLTGQIEIHWGPREGGGGRQ